MRVLIDGVEVESLTDKEASHIRLGSSQPEAVSRILSRDDAVRRREDGARIVSVTLDVVVTVILGAAAIGALTSGGNTINGPLFMVLILALIPLLIAAIHWKGRNTLRAFQGSLDGRMANAPPGGCEVRVDATGLTLDARFFSWAALGIEMVRLTSDSESSNLTIERLVLRGAAGTVALDIGVMEKGQRVVNEIYRQLAPPR